MPFETSNPVAAEIDRRSAAPPSAAPFAYRTVTVLLKLLGADSRPRFLFFQSVLTINLFIGPWSNVWTEKYRDNHLDPQRPFLAPMHAFLCWLGLIGGLAALLMHRRLVSLQSRGCLAAVVETALSQLAAGSDASAIRAVTVVGNIAAGFLLFLICSQTFLCRPVMFFSICAPLSNSVKSIAMIADTMLLVFKFVPELLLGPGEHSEEVSPFSTNFTVPTPPHTPLDPATRPTHRRIWRSR